MMPDPRYKNGSFKGFDPVSRRPELDTPPCHGWTRIGENEHGLSIFELGRAFMRPTSPADKTSYDWLVFIGSEVYGYNGSLAQITADVRERLGLPGQPYFLLGYVIPAEAFGGSND